MRHILLVHGLLLVIGSSAFAQTWTPPAAAARCPSKWGANDERGAANHVTAASVLRASKLIRTGEIIELGRVLTSTMPLFGTRTFGLHTKRTNGPLGSNKRYSNEELVVTELGQVGTQLDMFSHQGIDGQSYNCVPIDSIGSRNGFQKLGIDKIGTLFARGVLIDVAAFKGVDMLSASYEITPGDLQGAIAKQGLSLSPGDAVLIHTGWGQLWDKEVARYSGPAPGVGLSAVAWLASQDVMLIPIRASIRRSTSSRSWSTASSCSRISSWMNSPANAFRNSRSSSSLSRSAVAPDPRSPRSQYADRAATVSGYVVAV
jgi:hypothetical protein